MIVNNENKINKVREITLTAMMIALCIVLRYVFVALPNIKPITAIIILISTFISTPMSIFTGIGVMTITGFTMGFGIWIPLQILGYILISLGAKYLRNTNIIFIIIFGIIGCFVYGFIVNFSMLVYVPFDKLIPTWISGLYFDLLHAISTSAFILVLYEPFKLLSQKMKVWLYEN